MVWSMWSLCLLADPSRMVGGVMSFSSCLHSQAAHRLFPSSIHAIDTCCPSLLLLSYAFPYKGGVQIKRR